MMVCALLSACHRFDLSKSPPTSRAVVTPAARYRLRSYWIGCGNAGLPLLVPVHVGVDDARHDVLAGGVDHRVRRSRRGRNRERQARHGVGRADIGNQPVLHDDVDRTVGRFRVAVNHHRVLDHETVRGLGVDRRRGGRLLGGQAESHQGGERDAL